MIARLRAPLSAALLLGLSAGAQAQSQPQKIAYTVMSGSTISIYVSNPDGSGAVKLFQGASKAAVGPIDMAPGGGRIAFANAGALKVVSYTVSGGTVIPGPVTTLVASGVCDPPDFSADGNNILYGACGSTHPWQTRVVAASGGTPRVLLTSAGYGPRWLASGDIVLYGSSGPNQYEVRRATVDPDGSVTQPLQVLFTTAYVSHIDTARNYDAILVTGTSAAMPTVSHLYEVDLGCNTVAEHPSITASAHYSTDDTAVIYTDRNYLYRYALDTGAHTRLAGKRAAYGFTDWQPPAAPTFHGCPL